MKKETRLVHGIKGFDEKTGAISYPIYQSATFRHPGLNVSTGYDQRYLNFLNPAIIYFYPKTYTVVHIVFVMKYMLVME
ncbi:MAG: cystathionine beta-lyase/cystathionine gamma-synthase [Clostridiales bacterium]|nr:cystathionine beta-lyase/cystathionine gamma-synthase [Clostridiales bacterium]